MEIEKEDCIGLTYEDLADMVSLHKHLFKNPNAEVDYSIPSECEAVLERLVNYKWEIDQSAELFPIKTNGRKYQPAINSPKDGSVFKIREIQPHGNSKRTIKAYWGQCNGQLALICQKEPTLVFNAHCYEWKPL